MNGKSWYYPLLFPLVLHDLHLIDNGDKMHWGKYYSQLKICIIIHHAFPSKWHIIGFRERKGWNVKNDLYITKVVKWHENNIVILTNFEYYTCIIVMQISAMVLNISLKNLNILKFCRNCLQKYEVSDVFLYREIHHLCYC
jgi:hypothetical protein